MSYVVIALLSLLSEYFLGVWLFHIPMYWPAIIWHGVITAVSFCAFSAIWEGIKNNGYGYDWKSTYIGAAVIAALLIVGFFVDASNWPIVNASAYRNLGDVTVSNKSIDAVSQKNIRLLPKASAAQIGKQAIGKGNIGSRYELDEDHYDVQMVNGTIYWVAPLEFRGFLTWNSTGGISPGYVMVNAEDKFAAPKLVEGKKMRYTWGAWFSSNYLRYMYLAKGYRNVGLTEPTFEVDDNGKPYYVISLTRPTLGFNGPKLLGAAILDPETGEVKRYSVDKLPKWVDRAFPEEMAKIYTNNWGKYVSGWWNSIVGIDVQEISSVEVDDGEEEHREFQDVFLVHNKENDDPVWVTGMTSPSKKDTSLTGYMAINSRNGKMTYYPAKTGSLGNESAVIKSVDSDKVVSIQKTYRASQPIFYNIYGVESWVVPVLSKNNIVEMVAIVYANDTRQVAVGETKQEALENYKDLLSEIKATGIVPTDAKDTKKIAGKIIRITDATINGSTRFYLLIDSDQTKLFEVSSRNTEILGSQVGDRVQITYDDTSEDRVAVKSFDDLELNLTKSQPQREYEQQVQQQKTKSMDELKKQQEELQKQINDTKKQMDELQ
ncbi:MAG: hypothetical protein UU65_C0004G0003 [candidate division CPR2 bacterium GW2011_GWC1_41_48]|uniref:Uncharacterized protein n=1 Tax=candidate division CPR2 bacterium GW2011_GWC1_41_48 TaxID=1618344 RepID=A0A0G0W9Q7_UNCC2|nr:MAG: hypothetical protein UT47_C0004G0117 [candidate division CPR2 bacterium GW2011_GWC2_39_35]KKR27829.1 MAG: hypothetical protein UT60_C0035G0005 [candidate division CPR2 bacterium GW2011_GWD2_39_7]KKS08792.1 MAG: hypothetical protein UU65_C0004G0003 [candidate division CPR2 bacterium GW2011_GWC1_41_48]